MTNREKAKEFVNKMTTEDLEDFIVRGHTSQTHEWVECLPDGSIHETEEADNNTRHYISYPDTEVENIYDISRANCGCNCDICTMYKHFEGLDEDEFEDAYGRDMLDYCKTYTIEQAILDECGEFTKDVMYEMLDAIDEIPYGYFDDEK